MPDIDITVIFNLLAGDCQIQSDKKSSMRK